MTSNPRQQVPLLRFFVADGLPEPQRTCAARYTAMANMLADSLPHGSEKATALRKLLESMDAALRALSDLDRGEES